MARRHCVPATEKRYGKYGAIKSVLSELRNQKERPAAWEEALMSLVAPHSSPGILGRSQRRERRLPDSAPVCPKAPVCPIRHRSRRREGRAVSAPVFPKSLSPRFDGDKVRGGGPHFWALRSPRVTERRCPRTQRKIDS